jgi:hypothetical protein
MGRYIRCLPGSGLRQDAIYNTLQYSTLLTESYFYVRKGMHGRTRGFFPCLRSLTERRGMRTMPTARLANLPWPPPSRIALGETATPFKRATLPQLPTAASAEPAFEPTTPEVTPNGQSVRCVRNHRPKAAHRRRNDVREQRHAFETRRNLRHRERMRSYRSGRDLRALDLHVGRHGGYRRR